MVAVVVVHLLSEQRRGSIRKRHPLFERLKQRMSVGMIGSFRKHVPKQGCRKPAQIEGRVRGDVWLCMIEKGLNVVLSTSLLFLLKLIADKGSTVLHAVETDTKDAPVKVDDFDEESKRRNAVQHSPVSVIEKLLGCLYVHYVVAVEVIVSESNVPLGVCERKHHLRHPRNVLLGF